MRLWIVLFAFVASACTSGPKFNALFDGETLDGWVTKGGRYDGTASWTVEDGAITGRVDSNGAGGLIYSERTYQNFILELDAWIDYPFDSGIFIHMSPQAKGVQVTIDYRPDGEVGGIYSDGWLEHNRDGKGRFRRGAWNHFRVECRGGRAFHLQVWMNGEPLTEYQLTRGIEAYAETGLIGLQVHGGRDDPRGNRARFRNIELAGLDC